MIRLILLLALLAFDGSRTQEAIRLKDVLHADISQTESFIVDGQPMVIVLQLLASDNTTVDLGGDGTENVKFIIRDTSGRQREAFLPQPEFRVGGRTPIEKGVPYRQRIDISSLIQPALVGFYIIDVEIVDSARKSILISVDRSVTVEIRPKDPDLLRSVCERLKDQLQAAPTLTKKLELAHELSAIHDPVAVPSIKAALDTGFPAGLYLFRTLQDIGSLEAIDVLQSWLTTKDPDAARDSLSALKYIANWSPDKSLRDRASAAVSTLRPR